eukprot:CAMPEP_0172361892 /NCGR_PEP_ID=MMETSP1060-20121228/5653_1 /TAXON_ID=37318 /ORGANISM="Pseudo-nitzschia pungens, Strain cf. cingulata" /LENGTH=1046 /DNA_ID=CAMNT_0013084285 /DNA_START=68 /DNA_END=3208 /DNA_ORIENTATION=+
MSDNDDYVSLNLSKDIDDNRSSLCDGAKEQLSSAYHALVDNKEAIIPGLQLLLPFSKKETSDIREALRGDYNENYHQVEDDIFLLPEHRIFEQRLERSTFDNMNLEYNSFKFRFLVPFIIKAELKPGLAFGEALLTLVHIMTLFSVLTNGMSFMAMIIGGGSLFLLLTILHFWYGISRYPSLWNSFTPYVLKGAAVDRNFLEIRKIFSYHCNGHDQIYSQLKPFVLTLPFTIIYHVNGFLVTAVYYLFRISRNGSDGRKRPPPVTVSLFLSNILISSFWVFGGTSGIILATSTVVVNQKVYDSLLFNRDLKDFCISLVFGNLVLIQKKITLDEIGLAQPINAAEHDIESGIQIKKEEDRSYQPATQKFVKSTQVEEIDDCSEKQYKLSMNSFADPPQHTVPTTIQNIISFGSDEVEVEMDGNISFKSKPKIFIDESPSQLSEATSLQYLLTVVPIATHTEDPEKIEACTEMNSGAPKKMEHVLEVKTEEEHLSTKSSTKKFFSRLFSSPRKKKSSKRFFPEDEGGDEISVEFFNPSDVHLDMENHPGTIKWRNIISESVQKFRMKSYTLRKHIWVMNKMHGKSFFIKQNGRRRRKLKRKEIKECCKAFHDKQLQLNSELSGILDDLKDLKKNHSNSKSSSDHTRSSFAYNNSKSNSDHTRSSLMNNPLEIRDDLSHLLSTVEEEWKKPGTNDHCTVRSADVSSTKESLVESSKESTISTLTLSYVHCEHACHDETKEKEGVFDSSASFTDRVNKLLECKPWIDNMNNLRESGSGSKQHGSEASEGSQGIVDAQNGSPHGIDGLKSCLKETGNVDGEISAGMFGDIDEGGKALNKPYWRTFVEGEPRRHKKKATSISSGSSRNSEDPIPVVQSKSGKRRRLHPWKSDLQKKKLEKARKSRIQDQELSTKKLNRVITIFKMKKTNVVVEEHVIHSPRSRRKMERKEDDSYHEDRQEEVENVRCEEDMGDDDLRDCECIGGPSFGDETSSYDIDIAELNSPTNQAKGAYVHVVDYEPGVGAQHNSIEQRGEENVFSDVRLMSENHFVRY